MDWIDHSLLKQRTDALIKRSEGELRDLRGLASERLAAGTWPKSSMELWKNLDLTALYKTPYRLEEIREPVEPRQDADFQAHLGVLPRMVFIDGKFSEKLSSLRPQNGASIEPVSSALSFPDVVQNHAFLDLNTATFETGAQVKISKRTTLEHPLVVLFLSTAASKSHVVSYKNVYELEEGSRAHIVEVCMGENTDAFSTNFTHAKIGKNARLSHTKIQMESTDAAHFGGLLAELCSEGTLDSYHASLGGKVSRQDIHAVLSGTHSSCNLNGLYCGTREQTLDHYTTIDHASAHTSSTELYKGILDQRAHGGFTGKIIVRPEAQKTDSRQLCRNLLLSREAQADALPQLEIFANDVRCSHGATLGALNEDEIFYLRSRGFSAESAKRELIMAFAEESFQSLDASAVRAYVASLLKGRVFA